MNTVDVLGAIGPVAEALERLGAPYYIGGSIASSAYGIARATLDVDMVSDLALEHARPLARMLESCYYVDDRMISDAVRTHSAFNVIHLETMAKVDVFVAKDEPYHRGALQRRRKDTLAGGEEGPEFYLASPEDVILAKLEWYRMGGNVSDRQWTDVLGVLKVQQSSLDGGYLRQWASELGLGGLLEHALRDAGVAME